MILRLIIAAVRWSWGVSPAFVTLDMNNEGWWAVMVFGAFIDIGALVGVVGSIVCWIKDRRAK